MTIVFTKHAREQLKERNLSERMIKEILLEPDKTIHQTGSRYVAVRLLPKVVRQYLVVVAYDKRGGTMKVVTAFISSKLHKYL